MFRAALAVVVSVFIGGASFAQESATDAFVPSGSLCVQLSERVSVPECVTTDANADGVADLDPATNIQFCSNQADIDGAIVQNENFGICEVYKQTWSGRMDLLWGHLSKDENITALTNQILAFVAAAASLAAIYFRTLLSRLRNRLFDPYSKPIPKLQTLAVNVLFLGHGGVGKTSLIRALAGSSSVNPRIATNENRLYALSQEFDYAENGAKCRRIVKLFISDHVGQDPASVFKTSFVTDEALQRLPKCLVVVVDVFAPNEPYAEDNLFDTVDDDRINQQVSLYGDNWVRSVTDRLEDGSKIILFVNKLDKIERIDGQTLLDVQHKYAVLIEKLRSIRGIELRVVLGSANTGMGISGGNFDMPGSDSYLLLPSLIDAAGSVNR